MLFFQVYTDTVRHNLLSKLGNDVVALVCEYLFVPLCLECQEAEEDNYQVLHQAALLVYCSATCCNELFTDNSFFFSPTLGFCNQVRLYNTESSEPLMRLFILPQGVVLKRYKVELDISYEVEPTDEMSLIASFFAQALNKPLLSQFQFHSPKRRKRNATYFAVVHDGKDLILDVHVG